MEINYPITPELPEESALYKLGQLIRQKNLWDLSIHLSFPQQQQLLSCLLKVIFDWRKGFIQLLSVKG